MAAERSTEIEAHLQVHVSTSDFTEVNTDLKWIKRLLTILVPLALGVSILDLALRAID